MSPPVRRAFKDVEAERPAFDADFAPHYTQVPDVRYRPGSGLNSLPYSDDFKPENAEWRGVDPKEFERSEVYKLMISAITPRPIALLSTMSPEGDCNLAPYSLFNMVSADPPTIMISIQNSPTNANGLKDSAQNILETREFCVSIISEPFLEASHMTSTDLPPDLDEWRLSGLTKRKSEIVSPPHVAESAFSMECALDHYHTFVTDQGVKTNTVVFGRVKRFHIKEFILDPADPMKVRTEKLRPISRLGGLSYSRSTQFCDMVRPVWDQVKADPAVEKLMGETEKRA